MPDDAGNLVSVLYPELHDQAAVAMGRAFVDDPLFRALIPEVSDPAARVAAFTDLFRGMFAVERRTGQPAFGVIDDGKVVAAAATEGTVRPSAVDVSTAGLAKMPQLTAALGLSGIRRAGALFRVLSQSHPDEPHLYLQALGVDPDYQGRRLGTMLLEHLRAQARAHPHVSGVYLETSKEANVAYYSARGYQVIGEIYPIGVRTWRMYQRVRG